jgi:ataxia telangiectasia mutated family protein
MCQEHPFHTLYQLWCISDHQPLDRRRHSGRFSQSTQSERGSAATTILERLRDDQQSAKKVKDIELLCDACLEWAKFPIRKNDTYRRKARGGFAVPSVLKILKINGQNLKVPVLTARLPLDLTLKYDNCIWIDRYSRTFETAGGINLPKVSVCHGSNGQNYKQLVSLWSLPNASMASEIFD